MADALQHLESDTVIAALAPEVAEALSSLTVEPVVASTNQSLLSMDIAPGRLAACLAEAQSAGRGRHGREWHSPPGRGVYLSVGIGYSDIPGDVAAMTVAAGLIARQRLKGLGVGGVMLKWPNDLVHSGGKLGGILAEGVNRSGVALQVVVGIGINVALDDHPIGAAGWARSPVSLRDVCPSPPAMSVLAGELASGLGSLLLSYPSTGFAPYRHAFEEADALAGVGVTLQVPGGTLTGKARGIDARGALRIEAGGRIRSVNAGEVTVRSIH